MKVIRASVLGFCMGVKKAVEAAKNAIENPEFAEKKIFTLGPLIHNPSVLKSLENQGVTILSENQIQNTDKNSIVLIRAHGTTPSVLSMLEKKGAFVIDSTCPKVHLSQKRAVEWHNKGYNLVIAGDKKHGEVSSILSYVENDGIVVETAEEAKMLPFSDKVVLLAQTTFSPVEFEKICQVIKQRGSDVQIFNSICNATMERQNSLKELAGKADGMLIIGGKTSANTRRLYESASLICNKVALIEDETEIPEDFYNLDSVALSAGASTPDWIIDNVEAALVKKASV